MRESDGVALDALDEVRMVSVAVEALAHVALLRNGSESLPARESDGVVPDA